MTVLQTVLLIISRGPYMEFKENMCKGIYNHESPSKLSGEDRDWNHQYSISKKLRNILIMSWLVLIISQSNRMFGQQINHVLLGRQSNHPRQHPRAPLLISSPKPFSIYPFNYFLHLVEISLPGPHGFVFGFNSLFFANRIYFCKKF